jgi:hypothetical protein
MLKRMHKWPWRLFPSVLYQQLYPLLSSDSLSSDKASTLRGGWWVLITAEIEERKLVVVSLQCRGNT